MKTLPVLVKSLHWDYFSTIINTWCKSISAGLLTTWTGLKSSLVHKHSPKSTNKTKVQLILTSQHVRLNNTPPPPPIPPL